MFQNCKRTSHLFSQQDTRQRVFPGIWPYCSAPHCSLSLDPTGTQIVKDFLASLLFFSLPLQGREEERPWERGCALSGQKSCGFCCLFFLSQRNVAVDGVFMKFIIMFELRKPGFEWKKKWRLLTCFTRINRSCPQGSCCSTCSSDQQSVPWRVTEALGTRLLA